MTHNWDHHKHVKNKSKIGRHMFHLQAKQSSAPQTGDEIQGPPYRESEDWLVVTEAG